MFVAVDGASQIAAAVTPAVMVSACGLVALGLDNQTARMSARLRELTREWRELPPPSPRRALLAEQVEVLDRRHGLYSRALLANYGALLAFVGTSLLWLLQAATGLPAALPVALFGLGVVLLAAMAVLVIAAILQARSTIEAEAAEVLRERRRGPRPPRGEPASVRG
jgi:hypothetical protein